MKQSLTLAHLICPVDVPASHELARVQPITFASMLRAQAKARGKGLSVALYSVQCKGERAVTPRGFVRLPPLSRTVGDLKKFAVPRRLPLLQDILGRFHVASRADYFIFTNSDIALHEDFYLEVQRLAQKGHRGFIINRRTVVASLTKARNLDWLQKQKGRAHPGMDCFVFHREALMKMPLGEMCVGMGGFSGMFGGVLSAVAGKFKLFADLRLTFHLGDARSWDDPRYNDYKLHNLEESIKTALGILLVQKGTPLLHATLRKYRAEAKALRLAAYGKRTARSSARSLLVVK